MGKVKVMKIRSYAAVVRLEVGMRFAAHSFATLAAAQRFLDIEGPKADLATLTEVSR